MTVESFAWMDRALCANSDDPDLWFDPNRRREAQRICATCPVADRCQDRGSEVNAFRGVWGGEARALTGPGPSTTNEYLEPDHGTPARYRQHLRDKTPACARCLIAHQYEQAKYEARNPRTRDGENGRAVRSAARKRVNA